MNPGETESKPASDRNPEGHRTARRWRWRRWVVLFAVAGAVIWFVVTRTESPQDRVEREVRRILSPVRKQDRSSFNLYSVAEAMYQWPQPFPKFAEWLIGAQEWSGEGSEELAALGQPAIPILTNLLVQDRSAAVRSTVAEALGEMRESRLVPQLITAFGKEHQTGVQSSILMALGQIGDDSAEPMLLSVLQGTNDSSVRTYAANALVNFQSLTALAALTNSLLTDADSDVRSSIARTLYSSSETAVQPALLTALKSDTDASVRQQAAFNLAAFLDDNTTAALLTALREDADTRSVRPMALGALRDRTNVVVRAAMLETLKQSFPELRLAAARALENFPGPDTESALLELLATDPVANVRSAAVNTIGELAATQTNRALLPTMIKVLQTDPEPDVRAAAAAALNRIGGEEVVKVLRTALEKERKGRVQVEAIGGIYRQQGTEMTVLLLQLLNDPNLEPEARVEVIRCLGVTRDPSTTPKLVALLAQDSDENIRSVAASALGSLDTTNAVVALVEALQKDDSTSVRAGAATALGRGRSSRPQAISALVRVLEQHTDNSARTNSVRLAAASTLGNLRDTSENSVRMAAATSLGALRATNALVALLKVLQRDPDREMRASVATALGKLGRAEAIPSLEAAYRSDRHREVRAHALSSLGLLAGETRTEFFIQAFEADPASRATLAGILGRIGSPETVTVLLKSLNEGGWGIRSALSGALGDAGDARAVAPLIELLTTERNPATRAAAATALGCLCNPEAVPALEAALGDRIASVRQEAAWALGHIGDTRAVAALSRTLDDRSSEVRFAAAFALAEVGERSAVPALESLLTHADERTRLAAASALAFLDNAQGLPVLNGTLRSRETWQRFTGLISLLRLNTPEARRLLTDCHDSDSTLAAVIEAGLRLGGAGSATNLLATASDEDSMMDDYRHFGARALVLFSDPATLPALEAYANDAEDDVRSAVRLAIRRIHMRAGPEDRQSWKSGK